MTNIVTLCVVCISLNLRKLLARLRLTHLSVGNVRKWTVSVLQAVTDTSRLGVPKPLWIVFRHPFSSHLFINCVSHRRAFASYSPLSFTHGMTAPRHRPQRTDSEQPATVTHTILPFASRSLLMSLTCCLGSRPSSPGFRSLDVGRDRWPSHGRVASQLACLPSG
jgi:hypothetical protein